jgi:hypothetical protein
MKPCMPLYTRHGAVGSMQARLCAGLEQETQARVWGGVGRKRKIEARSGARVPGGAGEGAGEDKRQ